MPATMMLRVGAGHARDHDSESPENIALVGTAIQNGIWLGWGSTAARRRQFGAVLPWAPPARVKYSSLLRRRKAGHALKPSIFPAAARMARKIMQTANHRGSISTLDELDAALENAAKARKISETRFLETLSAFWLDVPPPPVDPWSTAYKQHWWDIYRHLAGREYAVDNELYEFDVADHVVHPYPYCTRDPVIVSRQLAGIGAIIGALSLPPGSSLLEMGAGWGNLSLFLAQMGYKVSVLDINPRYGSLIGRRAAALGVDIEFIHAGFDEAPDLGRRFDCVLFFESFHHSYDHLRLLDRLPRALSANGLLALAGEPMNENLPYDWGINPAGEALWQIRTHGWFELVFRESYLIRTLQHKGYAVRKADCPGNPVGTTLICRRT